LENDDFGEAESGVKPDREPLPLGKGWDVVLRHLSHNFLLNLLFAFVVHSLLKRRD
jgi:hypothetical protein